MNAGGPRTISWAQHFAENPDVDYALGSKLSIRGRELLVDMLNKASFSPARVAGLSADKQVEAIKEQVLMAANKALAPVRSGAGTERRAAVEQRTQTLASLLPVSLLMKKDIPNIEEILMLALQNRPLPPATYINWDGSTPGIVADLAPMFQGVRDLSEQNRHQPDDAFVRERLLPYAKNALDQAENRLEKNGIERWRASAVLLRENEISQNEAVQALPDRQWSEFVAALSMEAAERLGRAVVESKDDRARHVLQGAAENKDIRVALPAWHPLAGRYVSVADWISLTYGLPDKEIGLGLRLPNIFGIPVIIGPGAFILSALMAFTCRYNPHSPMPLWSAIAMPIALYLSALLHEYGHALAARHYGLRTVFISLGALKGGTEVDVVFLQRSRADFLIAFAGPAVTFALAALFGIISWILPSPLAHAVAQMDFVLGVINVMPAFPNGRRPHVLRHFAGARTRRLARGATDDPDH